LEGIIQKIVDHHAITFLLQSLVPADE